MLKLTTVCIAAVLLSITLACHRIEDDDLVGRFVFERGPVPLELRIDRDHTYSETITADGITKKSNGTWRYWDGPRNLSLYDVWVPSVPLGSNQTQLRKTAFSFHVDSCDRKLCLGVSDNDPPLRFVGE
jgi:hypothetical protein